MAYGILVPPTKNRTHAPCIGSAEFSPMDCRGSPFEFIFVCSVRKCSNFILLHVVVQFSWYHLIKRLSFSPLYILAFFYFEFLLDLISLIK